jgi:hypothetical protein
MSGGTGGNSPNQVAGLDGVNGGATDAHLPFFCQAAGPHATNLAAHPRRTDVAGAISSARVKAVSNTNFVGPDQHFLRRRVYTVLRNFASFFAIIHLCFQGVAISSQCTPYSSLTNHWSLITGH